MIVYLHESQQPLTPAWFDGFRPLPGSQIVHRDTDRGHLVGIGDPLVFEPPSSRAFLDLGDGWSVAQAGPIDPRVLFRRPTWCKTEEVTDLGGMVWRAPLILDIDGERDFLFRFGGRDFLPVLTDEQQRCEAIARAAREAVSGGIEMGPEACRWASVLLAATNAIPPEAIAELNLLDHGLVIAVLSYASGLPMKLDVGAE